MLACPCRPLRWYAPARSPCKAVLGCRAVPTRREYIPVGSLMSSLTSNGRIRDVPTQRRKLRVADGFTSSSSEFIGELGAGLCRPSVFRDENRELTWMYLQRVGTALHPSTTLHRTRSRGVPTQSPTPKYKHELHLQRFPVKCDEPFFVLNPHHRYPQRLVRRV